LQRDHRFVKIGGMIKKLTKVGNSLALIIDRSILDLLNIAEDAELEITTDGESLQVRPAQARARRLREVSKKITTAHAATFRKLAK
jgi:antitoxin MazE